MIVSEIESEILAIETNKILFEEANFNLRVEALDFIDFHIIDRIEGELQKSNLEKELALLRKRAESLMMKLEKVDKNLFKTLQEQLKISSTKGSALRLIILKYLGLDINAITQSCKAGYDNLDVFINELFSNQLIPEPTKDRKPEMVFYQKTPARIIFYMLAMAKIKQDDVFFDLGSGLGQIVILVNLMTGITAKGIEYEPSYSQYAKLSASQLNLSNISFIVGDARDEDYSDGSIFFLYTPFEGSMLQRVMELLKTVAQKKIIKVFTYGPCSVSIARLSWLICVNGKADNFEKLYEFRSLTVTTQ